MWGVFIVAGSVVVEVKKSTPKCPRKVKCLKKTL
jgi:hypothetical protein